MTIYSPILITEQVIQSFIPCRLYIKELCGLKYFGKTSQNPYDYHGSGKIWKDKIKKYGKENIKTLWVSDIYTDPSLLQEVALGFSKENMIVESVGWANLKPENGLDGGWTHLPKVKQKISSSVKRLWDDAEFQERMSHRNIKGKNNGSYNHTVYTWYNKKTGETLDLTKGQFVEKFSAHAGNVSSVIHGKLKSTKGWIVI